MDQIRKFHYSELQNLILCLFQNIFKTEEQKIVLKPRMELSYLRENRIFLYLIEKLESRRSLENLSFKVYLKIRLLEIECENENF